MKHYYRKLTSPCFAALAVAVVLSLAAITKADAAESTEAEFNRLFQELLQSPNDLDTMSRYAYLATEMRNYEAAIATYERMLLINPNLPSVRLQVGVLYYRLKAYETAKIYLQGVLDDPATQPTAKARAQRYLNESEDRLSAHSLHGGIMAGVRYQTNANFGPSSDTVLSDGFEVALPAGFAEQDDVNGFLSGRLRHRWDFDTPLDEAWITDFVHYGTRQADIEDLDVGYLELRTGPRFAVLPKDIDTLFLRPFFISNVAFVDHDIYNYGFGGGVNLEKEYGEDTKAGIRYIGLHQDFKDVSMLPDDSSDGAQHRVAVYAFDRPTNDLSVFGQARYIDNQADAAHKSYDRADFFARIAQYYDPPFGLNWPWQVALHGWYIFEDYDAPDPTVDPFTVREDHEYRVGISNNFQFSQYWSIFWLLEYINVDSNLPNFTYDNLSTLIAARRRF